MFRRGFGAEPLQEIALHAHETVDRFYHVYRDSYGARLVRNGPAYRLTDPPGRVCAEFVSFGVVKFVDSAQETDIALLNQIEKADPPAYVPLRDTNDQPQIGARQIFGSHGSLMFDLFQLLFGQVNRIHRVFDPTVEFGETWQFMFTMEVQAHLHLVLKREQEKRVNDLENRRATVVQSSSFPQWR